MPNWIVVDVRDGGVDGYYASETDAKHMAEHAKATLGHDDVIVAQVEGGTTRPIGKCFMSEKRIREKDLSL